MCIVHKGFGGFRAVCLVLKKVYKKVKRIQDYENKGKQIHGRF